MKAKVLAIVCAGVLALGGISAAFATPSPPTNGGSAQGGGASGQCTGPMADRPAACHNGNGAGN